MICDSCRQTMEEWHVVGKDGNEYVVYKCTNPNCFRNRARGRMINQPREIK